MTSPLSTLVALLAWSAAGAAAFQPRNAAAVVGRSASFFSASPTASALGAAPIKKGGSEDFPEDDVEYKGDVDWDAEWKKVVEKQGQGGGGGGGGSGGDRPGKDFYKSDVERATIKSVNTVVERVNRAADSMPKVQTPNIRSLRGDWKFWIAILAIISVGTSLLAASGQSTSSFTNDPSSYYI